MKAAPVTPELAAIIGVSVAAAGSNPTTASAPKTTTTQPAAPASTPPAEPAAPDPKGTYTGSGDYILSPTLYGNSYLVGEVDMTNTGNIGLIVRVKFTWPQEGSPPIAAYKTIRVPYGQTRVARFHVSAGNVSNSTVIDQLQAWQTGHNYQDGYTWTAKITGTFGEAH